MLSIIIIIIIIIIIFSIFPLSANRCAVKRMKLANCWYHLSSLLFSVRPSIPYPESTVYRITTREASLIKKKPGLVN